MSVSKDNVRTNITFPRELKVQLEKIAKEQCKLYAKRFCELCETKRIAKLHAKAKHQ